MRYDAREGGQIFRDLSKNYRQSDLMKLNQPDALDAQEFSALMEEQFTLGQTLSLGATAAGAILTHRAEIGKVIFNGTP
ncbi:hypothetical protein LRS56_22695 [Pseudomonas poae]|nr:hypothetical protein LRS56_22695 [Pseudomonas poae]